MLTSTFRVLSPAAKYTGSHEAIYNQFAAGNQEFDVTPTQVTMVA